MVKGKKVKRINPIEGIVSTLQTMALGGQNPYRETNKVFRTEENGWIVDTCIAHDTGTWETGILPKDSKWVIVEQYEDEQEAQIGHDKWVKLMRENPNTELEDINVWKED